VAEREALEDIRLAVLYVQFKANSEDPEVLREAEREFESLVDRFYEGFPRFMTPRQYETARGHFELFLFFIDQALAHYREKAAGTEDRS